MLSCLLCGYMRCAVRALAGVQACGRSTTATLQPNTRTHSATSSGGAGSAALASPGTQHGRAAHPGGRHLCKILDASYRAPYGQPCCSPRNDCAAFIALPTEDKKKEQTLHDFFSALVRRRRRSLGCKSAPRLRHGAKPRSPAPQQSSLACQLLSAVRFWFLPAKALSLILRVHGSPE